MLTRKEGLSIRQLFQPNHALGMCANTTLYDLLLVCEATYSKYMYSQSVNNMCCVGTTL